MVLVAAVAATAVVVAVLRPDEQERFRSWLLDQPGVVSVRGADRALASGTVAARAYEPGLRAVVGEPLSPAFTDRLGRAVVAYAVRHPAVAGTSVELRQGSDAVLLSTVSRHNATTLAVLGAVRDLPGLVSVALTVSSGQGTMGATFRAGTDLPHAATTLARAIPDPSAPWVTGAALVVARDADGHAVRSEQGAVPTQAAARAFDLALRTDPAHAVTLVVRGSGRGTRAMIELGASPLLAATAAALHRSGFGLASRHEVVSGPAGELPLDERAWARAASTAIAQTPGVVSARIDVGSAEEQRPVTADLRVDPQVSFDAVLRSLPAPVERLEAHTSAAAPDYDRDDALAPDPEVDCPASPGGPNLAFSGGRDRVPKATSYLAALRAAASGATCVHWSEASAHGRPSTQTLLVRLPLAVESWRPVLDVVRARRADLGSAHPAVILLVPVGGGRLTGVFNLAEGEAPYVTALDADTRAEERQAQDALQPLVRYWARG